MSIEPSSIIQTGILLVVLKIYCYLWYSYKHCIYFHFIRTLPKLKRKFQVWLQSSLENNACGSNWIILRETPTNSYCFPHHIPLHLLNCFTRLNRLQAWFREVWLMPFQRFEHKMTPVLAIRIWRYFFISFS